MAELAHGATVRRQQREARDGANRGGSAIQNGLLALATRARGLRIKSVARAPTTRMTTKKTMAITEH